jgi:hypothetical protein
MEEKPEYLTDAEEMINNHPTVEIEPPRSVISRRGREFVEEDKPAFIKFSTGFKKELAGIDATALKVWIFIALSVNRNSGKANPGLRTIATGVGMGINTIQDALVRLDKEYNLLAIDRESRRYNIYEPLAFISANKTDPTVSMANTANTDDSPSVSEKEPSVSENQESVSENDQSVSHTRILNQRNQRNQNNQGEVLSSKEEKQNLPIDWQVVAGLSSEQIAASNEDIARKKVVSDLYEKEMGYNPLPWWTDKKLMRLLRFLMDKTPEQIKAFALYSKKEFSSINPAKARQNPDLVIDCWKLAQPAAPVKSEYWKDDFDYSTQATPEQAAEIMRRKK